MFLGPVSLLGLHNDHNDAFEAHVFPSAFMMFEAETRKKPAVTRRGISGKMIHFFKVEVIF